MGKKERWKEKQRQKAKEKMHKSIQNAEIYDNITKSNEQALSDRHSHHHSSGHSRKNSKEHKIGRRKKLLSFFYTPLIYCAIIIVLLSAVFFAVYKKYSKYIDGRFSFNEPVFVQSQQAKIAEIIPDETGNVIVKSDITFPVSNENYAKINCKKLGENAINIFFDGKYDARKLGAVQQNTDSVFGLPGSKSVYAYRNKFFSKLPDISQGDEIFITTNYGKFTYKVFKIEHGSSQRSFSDVRGEDVLVMWTDEITSILDNHTSNKLYVFSKMIDGPTIMD